MQNLCWTATLFLPLLHQGFLPIMVVEGSNILFAHVMVTDSHRTSIFPLAEALASKGHNLTYIFPLPKKIGYHPKIEEITPSKMVSILQNYVVEFDINFRLNNSIHQHLLQVFSKSLDLCEAFYDSPEIQEWLARPNLHYDLLLFDSSMGECLYGLKHLFKKAKHILFVPVFLPHIWDSFGLAPPTSSIPLTVGYRAKPGLEAMSFINRLLTTVVQLLWSVGRYAFMHDVEALIRRKLNVTDEEKDIMPSLLEIEREASLVLVNNYHVDDHPMPLPPLFQSYSGLWCSKYKMNGTKPLPNELSSFLKGGNDGFIYVSFGSGVKASAMPIAHKKKFLDVFASLPNLKFFWRWTGPFPENVPKNVFLEEWFPQNDLLAHPKIRGFITQAGRPSVLEALCPGVPMITIPIFADQDYNADRLEYIGGAINLELIDITFDTLRESIKNLTETDKYSKKMKELSKMFRDRPIDPLDNVVFWTEYVLRHNSSLLKPLGMQQYWWQRRLLDVWTLLIMTVLITSMLSSYVAFLIVKKIWQRKNKSVILNKSDITPKNIKLD